MGEGRAGVPICSPVSYACGPNLAIDITILRSGAGKIKQVK